MSEKIRLKKDTPQMKKRRGRRCRGNLGKGEGGRTNQKGRTQRQLTSWIGKGKGQ